MKMDGKYFRLKILDLDVALETEGGAHDALISLFHQIARDAAEEQREICRKKASVEKCWIHCIGCAAKLEIK